MTRLILVLMLLRLPTALFASHETAVTKGWSNTTERVAMAKPAKAVGMLSSYGNSAALQQERVIRGTVSDQSGELLIGVGVLVHGTLRAVYTDTDGKYEIKVPANRDTLAFKYFGMQDLLVAIGGRDVVNATLKESAQQLEEVVVTGYGDIAKEAYT
ncbi:MAG: carboxypeptidase-like regulatory domain-containing protein, partial [Bacteroidales bacterium]